MFEGRAKMGHDHDARAFYLGRTLDPMYVPGGVPGQDRRGWRTRRGEFLAGYVGGWRGPGPHADSAHFTSEKPLYRWVAHLKVQELTLELVIFETPKGGSRACGESPDKVLPVETQWIERLRVAGHPLLDEPDRRHAKSKRAARCHKVRLLEAAAERGRNLVLSLGR